MICPRCKAENPNNVQYCQKCGFKLFDTQTIDCKICPNCGKLNALDQATCSNCHYDLSHVQVEQQTQKQFTTSPHRSKKLLVVVIIMLIAFGASTIIGSVFNHGWEGSEALPLRVKRYTADGQHHRKTFYIALAFERYSYRHVGHNYYIVPSQRVAENMSGRQILQKYKQHPAKRVNIIASSVANQHFAKIQYLGSSTAWYPLKSGKNYLSKGIVVINGTTYCDRIYTEEAE